MSECPVCLRVELLTQLIKAPANQEIRSRLLDLVSWEKVAGKEIIVFDSGNIFEEVKQMGCPKHADWCWTDFLDLTEFFNHPEAKRIIFHEGRN